MNLFIAASRFSQNSLFNVSIIPPVFLILCKYKGFLRKSQRIISFFSKTHQSSLTLKGGSTAFPKPLSPQGTGDVPTALLGAQTASLYGWRTIRGLRQQRSCSFFVRDKPQGHGGAADANAGTWGLLLMGTQGHNAGGLWNHLADTPTVLHQD